MKKKFSHTLKPAITLDELEASTEFRACTAKQQHWLTELTANGFNFTDATLAAFACGSRRNALIRSFAVRKSPFVRAALALLLGKPETEIVHENQRSQIARLLREVSRNLRAAQPGSVAAQSLLAQKERLIRSLTEAETRTLTPTEPSATPDAPPATPQVPDPRIPPDALKVWLDGNSAVVGYRDSSGQDVRL